MGWGRGRGRRKGRPGRDTVAGRGRRRKGRGWRGLRRRTGALPGREPDRGRGRRRGRRRDGRLDGRQQRPTRTQPLDGQPGTATRPRIVVALVPQPHPGEPEVLDGRQPVAQGAGDLVDTSPLRGTRPSGQQLDVRAPVEARAHLVVLHRGPTPSTTGQPVTAPLSGPRSSHTQTPLPRTAALAPPRGRVGSVTRARTRHSHGRSGTASPHQAGKPPVRPGHVVASGPGSCPVGRWSRTRRSSGTVTTGRSRCLVSTPRPPRRRLSCGRPAR